MILEGTIGGEALRGEFRRQYECFRHQNVGERY